VAMNRDTRPILGALRPAPGLIRVLGLRLGIVLLASLPALIAGLSGVASGVARRPYYTDVEGKLPLVHLLRLFRDLPGGFAPAAAVGVVLVVLADQLLLGGVMALFDPARPAGEKVRVFATVLRDGLTHLWAFLRAIGLSLILWAIGIGLIRFIFKRLDVMAYQSGWSGATSVLRLPLLSTFLMLVWIASAGAWAFWCRLITAADGRQRVRRTAVLVFRVFWRHPLRSWGIFTALTLASTLVSGAVLVAWRDAEPRSVGGVVGWLSLWLATLAAQSFVWLWLVRAGRLLYASESLADIRSKPDDPFRLFSKLLWWRKKPAKAPPAPEAPAETADQR
jgi:hypothetical protein